MVLEAVSKVSVIFADTVLKAASGQFLDLKTQDGGPAGVGVTVTGSAGSERVGTALVGYATG